MAHPLRPHAWDPLTLAQLHRLKKWHESHERTQPVEFHVWECVLTVWVMGWIGWLPAFAFEAPWAYPLCLLGVLTPRLYVSWRARAHEAQRLRCDWLDLLS
ncbi:hypothetical protein [Polaromonas jejuensis]|uniref:Transmembrane protein n=1 Tax=Polaromonas jejuensis TaxID=457502 RepID=A0ABW0QAA3_9BURK|nr:hypothetical protein [Polaromonas jejuensis]